MAFFYKPWTSEYQSQYTWKLRNQFRKPQDMLEKQMNELKALQAENLNKLSSLEASLKNKYIPEDEPEDENFLREPAEDEYMEEKKKDKELVLPKISENGNISVVEKSNTSKSSTPPLVSSSPHRPSSVHSNTSCNSKKNNNFCQKDVNEQIDELIDHYRRDGYGNEPWYGNKPTCYENEKLKKIPDSSMVIKNYEERLKQKRAQIYDSYKKEVDLRRLQQLFPYTNFNACNKSVGTQVYDDGIINGTYLSEYGSQYVNWRFPYMQFSTYEEKEPINIGDKYSKVNSNIRGANVEDLTKKKRINEIQNNKPNVNYYLQNFNRPEFQTKYPLANTIGTSTLEDKKDSNKYQLCDRCRELS